MPFLAVESSHLYRPAWNGNIMKEVISLAKKNPGEVPEVWFVTTLKARLTEAEYAKLKHPYPNMDPSFLRAKQADFLGHTFRLYMQERTPVRSLSNVEQAFVSIGMKMIHQRQLSGNRLTPEVHPTVALMAALVLGYEGRFGYPTPEDYVDVHLAPYIDAIPKVLYDQVMVRHYGAGPLKLDLMNLLTTSPPSADTSLSQYVYDSVDLWEYDTRGGELDDSEQDVDPEGDFDSTDDHNLAT